MSWIKQYQYDNSELLKAESMEEIFEKITLSQWKIIKDGLQAIRKLKDAQARAKRNGENGWTKISRRNPSKEDTEMGNTGSTIEVTSVTIDDNNTTNNNSQVSHLTNEVPSPSLKRKGFGGGKRR